MTPLDMLWSVGKGSLENAGLGGDNFNKVRSCANVFSRCAGYSTSSLQNILLDFD